MKALGWQVGTYLQGINGGGEVLRVRLFVNKSHCNCHLHPYLSIYNLKLFCLVKGLEVARGYPQGINDGGEVFRKKPFEETSF